MVNKCLLSNLLCMFLGGASVATCLFFSPTDLAQSLQAVSTCDDPFRNDWEGAQQAAKHAWGVRNGYVCGNFANGKSLQLGCLRIVH
jgi:hypothetical protein